MLNYGAFDTFGWIFKTFNAKEVKSLIDTKGIHSLSKNSYYFWVKIVKEKDLWKQN